MKTRLSLIALGFVSASLLSAQVFTPNLTGSGPVEAVPPEATDDDKRDADELDEIFGPIALYPDALIALILPATTVPADVVMAARYLAQNGDPARIDQQPWDESVRGLARYPDVVKWLDENLAWTKQAGEAFLAQPADVMNSIQRLRNRARAAGTLNDTPQQRVIVDPTEIRIVPVQPDVIYVPRYDPAVVYWSRPIYYYDAYSSPFITFGIGYAGGWWLSNRIDWPRRTICVIDRRTRVYDWRVCHEWSQPRFYRRPDYVVNVHVSTWRPPVVRTVGRPVGYVHQRPPVVRPRLIDGAPERHVTWTRTVETNRVATVAPQERRPSPERPGVWNLPRNPSDQRSGRGDNSRPSSDRRTSVVTYRSTSVIAGNSADTPSPSPDAPPASQPQPQPRQRVNPNRFDDAGTVNTGGEVRRSTTTIVRRNGEIVTAGTQPPAVENRAERTTRRTVTTTSVAADGTRSTPVVSTTTAPSVETPRAGDRRADDRRRTVTAPNVAPPAVAPAPASNVTRAPIVAPARTARGQAPDANASTGSSTRVYARREAPPAQPAVEQRPAAQPAAQATPPPPAAPAVAPAPSAPANTETAANSRANPRNNQRGGRGNSND